VGGGGRRIARDATKYLRLSEMQSGNLQNTVLSSVLNATIVAWNLNSPIFIPYEISDSKLMLVSGSKNQNSCKKPLKDLKH
jgi:hypothetical protein